MRRELNVPSLAGVYFLSVNVQIKPADSFSVHEGMSWWQAIVESARMKPRRL